MALTGFLIDIGAKLIVTLVFAVVNALILREVAVLVFKLKDDTMATALHVSVWLSIYILILSFMPMKLLINILAFIVTCILFVILVWRYYKISLKKSVLVWLVWFIVYFVLGLIVILISVLV